MHQQPLVRLTEVTRTYPPGRVEVRALTGVSLEVNRGDFLALAGPSGSGKTTLLNLIGCIDKPDSGRIVIDGVDVTPARCNAWPPPGATCSASSSRPSTSSRS